MKIFPLLSFIGLVIASLGQTDLVHGFPESPAKEIRSSAEPPIEASKCPDPLTIFPCTCSKFLDVDLECSGSAVNLSSIENAFREIRRVNEIPEDRGIHIDELLLNRTVLTQLDLAPLYGSRMHRLEIEGNLNLTKLVTSGGQQGHGSIQVKYLSLLKLSLNRQGFGDTLKYFSNELYSFSAAHLDLNNLNNPDFEEPKSESKSKSEFLPGLSTITNLYQLELSSCNISGGLDFDFLIPKHLGRINLMDNSISGIGENVFGLEGGPGGLTILLGGNKLNETSFHPNSGVARASRRTYLDLQLNQMTTLPALIFKPFLDAHSQNFLQLKGNPLICDQRLSWIKSLRVELKERVGGAHCSNDEGHTIFDSNLIP